MAKTVINVVEIMNSASKADSARSTVLYVEAGINSTRNRIDSKILGRNNINGRLINVQNLVGQINADVAKIGLIINNGALEYQNVENRVRGMGQELGVIHAKGSGSGGNNTYSPNSNGENGKNTNLNGKVLDEKSKERGKWDAFFGDIAYSEGELQLQGGVLAYTQGDNGIYLLGAEYENEVFHYFDEAEFRAYFAKIETGNAEHFYGTLGGSTQDSLGAGIEFNMGEIEDWINKSNENDDEQGFIKEATILEYGTEVGASASLYEGNYNIGDEKGEVKVTVGNAEAHAGVSAGLYVKGPKNEKIFSPGVNAEVGASVTALEIEWEQQWFGDENFGLNTDVAVTVGKAEAQAEATVQFLDEKGNVDIDIGASASAELIGGEIEGSIGANILGGEIGVTGGINYGIGAHAEVGFKDGVFKFDVGASLGVGLSLDFEIDIGGMIDTGRDYAKAAWEGIAEGWNKLWS